MAEFNVLKEYARMVQTNVHGSCEINCGDCPISDRNNGTSISCGYFMRMYPEKATEIIRKWSEEHPRKTYGDLVLEHFPNADLSILCPSMILGKEWDDKNCKRFQKCVDCRKAVWNEVVE